MIPVTEKNYTTIDLDQETLKIPKLQYQKLLKEQLNWLNANYNQVKSKSYKLYKLYNNNELSKNIKDDVAILNCLKKNVIFIIIKTRVFYIFSSFIMV